MAEIELLQLLENGLFRCCSNFPSFGGLSHAKRLFILCPTISIWQLWAVHDPDWRVKFNSPLILILLLLKHLYCFWLVCGCSSMPGLLFMISFGFLRVMKLLGNQVSASHWFLILFEIVVSIYISFGWFSFSVVFFTCLNVVGAICLTSAQSSVSSLIHSDASGSTDSDSLWSSSSSSIRLLLYLADSLLAISSSLGGVDKFLLFGFFVPELLISWNGTFLFCEVTRVFAYTAYCLFGGGGGGEVLFEVVERDSRWCVFFFA